MVSYLIYRLAFFGVRLVKRSVSVRVASFIALLFYLFRPRIKRNVRENLEALGAKSARPLDVFRNFSRTIADFLSISSEDPYSIRKRCRFVGTEHLNGALEMGRGAILCAPHMGPWEVAGACLAAMGYRIHTIALDHPSARVTEFFSERRSVWGVRDYPPGVGVSKLLEALRRNEVVVLLIDRIFSTKGIPLRFLGRKVMLPQGHVKLAERTGAVLIPCFCHYTRDDGIEAVICSPVDAVEGSTEATAEACLERIESFIRERPEQWFAFDHLWPEGPHA
jgi:KDO2-lipid IV(A) lauroyltransferase